MDTKNTLFSFINNLNIINSRKNIFHELPNSKDLPLGDYVAEYILFYEKELKSYISSINGIELNEFPKKVAGYSTERIIETIIGLNQYVEIDTILVSKLYDLYEDFVVKLFKKLHLKDTLNFDWINGLIMEHQLRLRGVLGIIDELMIFPKSEDFLDPVPCSEYTPAFQLKILNINLKEIKEPILDFGCGSNAKLVYYLRKLGLETYGVDRTISNKLYTIQANWFKYDLKPNYWGTIISHLSFSNHFKRNHYKKNGIHIVYAKKYMDLLDSLKLDGDFYYTPDLPFIEQFLPPSLYLINKKIVNSSNNFLGNEEALSIQSVQIKKIKRKRCY